MTLCTPCHDYRHLYDHRRERSVDEVDALSKSTEDSSQSQIDIPGIGIAGSIVYRMSQSGVFVLIGRLLGVIPIFRRIYRPDASLQVDRSLDAYVVKSLSKYLPPPFDFLERKKWRYPEDWS